MTVTSAPPHAGSSPARPADRAVHRPGLLGRVAGVSARRRGRVFVAWLAAVAITVLASSAFAGRFDADYSAPGSDSQAAARLLAERFPAVSGESVDLVVHSADGVRQPRVRDAVRATVHQLSAVPHVRAVADPYSTPGAIAPDGRTLMAHVQLDVALPTDMPVSSTEALIAAADRLPSVAGPGVRSAVGGPVIQQAEQGEIGSEGIGLAAAALILLLTFGSVVAAGLPILVAVTGLGVSSAGVGLIAALTDVPDWSTSLAAMMGIGVGIDYVLLLVTRYREFLAEGLEPRRAIVAMADTAGRAVLVAGTTVILSLLGLAAMGLSFMTGAALATILAVLVVMIAAITLLPALLSVVGTRIDRLRLPLLRRTQDAARPSGWARWSRTVQRRPRLTAASGLVVLAILAAPFLGVRFGFPDASNDAPTLSSRQAYDMVSDGFGVGANGPLVLVAELPGGGDVARLDALREQVASTSGVASVTPVVPNAAGDTAVLTVSPTTGPQSKQTEDLVRRLRDGVIPAATRGTGVDVHIGGVTPAAIDSTENIVRRLPALVAGVVGLSFVLLLTVFRSVAIAVKAAVVNLLSLGAAYGVVAYALEGGWFGRLFGIPTATPLPAFIPVLMFAVLFGLSMDYEVFLLSRIRERWLATGDRSASVTEGLTSTAGVITAAAAIMVAVFAAFIPSSQVTLKVIGIGMATAIFVDATVVRMVLVPAVMQLLGRATWWLPRWLDRLLPELHVEGNAAAYVGSTTWSPPLPRHGQQPSQGLAGTR